jgi:hypothetical protein
MTQQMRLKVVLAEGSCIVRALRVTPYFAVHREYPHWPSHGYRLTHIPTGYRVAGGLKDAKQAAALARALTRAFGVQRWNFTDPRAAGEMGKRPRAIIQKFGGTW